MATPYQNVYSRFLPKITDYSFVDMLDFDVEEYLETFLKSSIVKFRYCNKLIERNETTKEFVQDLTDEEQ
jgi:hypothetical protein